MKDKIEHFLVTMIITIIIGYLSFFIYGMIIALLFSLIKEIYDYKIKKEEIEFFDLLADVMGILFGVFILFII